MVQWPLLQFALELNRTNLVFVGIDTRSEFNCLLSGGGQFFERRTSGHAVANRRRLQFAAILLIQRTGRGGLFLEHFR